MKLLLLLVGVLASVGGLVVVILTVRLMGAGGVSGEAVGQLLFGILLLGIGWIAWGKARA